MIETISEINIEEILPLIRRYQEFYQVPDIDDEKNRRFFSQFGDQLDRTVQEQKGCLFGYRRDEKLVGFATVYFCFSSTIISKVAVMNDLFVLQEYRHLGIGRKLLEYCDKFGKSKGAARLQWVTAPDNKEAQSLYRSLGAKQSTWSFSAIEHSKEKIISKNMNGA